MKNMLFVCTGNTCRSPMAEGLFNIAIKTDNKNKQYMASSAGIYANVNEEATEYAIQALKLFNIDISNHRATRITYDMIIESELILTMTTEHKSELIHRFTEQSDKIFSLYEFVDNDKFRIVNDPYGHSEDVYFSCAMEIKEAIERLIEKLQ